jgi:alginate O-acetyltransferase complex protein AlgJ
MKPIEAHSTAGIKAKVIREEQAAHELGNTEFAAGTRVVLVVFFLAVIVSVPLAQFYAALRQPERISRFSAGLRALVPDWARVKAANGVVSAVKLLPPSSQIKRVEDDWEQDSVVGEALLPRMQSLMLALGQGNEKAYPGRDGWLFYRADFDYMTGRAFLDPMVLKRRATTGGNTKPPQPDPIKAIVQFRDQLAARGITLIVMPVPVKPSIYPEFFSRRYAGRSLVVQNPSFADFKQQLAQAGVAVFDPAALLAEAKARSPDLPLYLKTDTHWTPRAMELTAVTLAGFARQTVTLPAPQPGRFATMEKTVEAPGDVAMMLKLPAGQRVFPPEKVRVRQVLDGNRFWRPAADAEILILGDSYANIYSLEPMGWSEAAGFVEHLSLALGLPVDAICRNDAGSNATREMLAKELRRGQDRLAGKKLVIWEFAARELACGDWKRLPMTLGEKRDVGMYVPAAGKTVEIRAVVRAASPAPRPGSVPYKDHIVMVHLAEIESTDDPAADGKEAVAFIWSLRDNVATAASRYRPGDAVRLRLRPWADVAAKYEAINRSELEDGELLLAEPAWGQ